MEDCQQVESTTVLYKPCLQDNVVGGDVGKNSNSLNRDSPQGVELMSVDQCQRIPKMDDSQLVGNADVTVPGDSDATVETGAGNGVKAVEMKSAEKRRRGRPPRNQARIMSSSAPPPRRNKKDEDEEDVCFICFDGGSLVLCDRRGCPKAYHPACIKRDEAFFKSKAKWYCGWHICSTCQKASFYLCYTCTYSLCKNCTKDADYVNVRGNKGFCGMCMRTIMLIENSALGNKEMVQVDFDDKTSWEYLFKVYWVFLKEKLSLSLDELTKAKNPWKEIATVGPKGDLSGELSNGSNAKGGNGEKSFRDLGASFSKRRKTMKQQKFLNKVESLEAVRMGVMKGMPLPDSSNWATKELLEFVAHMKNGDISVISRFDVQELLLEYITRSNLRDPCQKSYIVCDSRLIKLFGKAKVGHIEMLKLLESHFLIQDRSRPIDTIRGGSIEAVATQVAVDWNKDGQPIIADEKSCKTSKKVDEKGEKAYPDVHSDPNMNLFHKSEEVTGESDEIKKENNMRPNSSVFSTKEKDPASPLKGGDVLSDIRSRETSIPLHSTGMELLVNNIETQYIWHYQDPHGKIQGPFPMAMLLRWSMSGHFPPDLRIWRASETQDDSILLADALDGRYSQAHKLLHKSCVPTEGVRIASDEGCQKTDGDAREGNDLNVNQMESKQVEGSLKSMQNDTSGQCFGNNESVKGKELGSQSSPCTASVDIVNSNAVQMGPLPHWDSMKGDNYFPGQPQVSSSLRTSTESGKLCDTQSHQVSEGHGVERWDCGSIDMNENLNKTSEDEINSGNVKQDDSDGKSGKSCGRRGRSSLLNDASNGWDLNCGLISLATALEASEHSQDIDFPNFPTSTSKLNHKDPRGQATKNQQFLSSNVSCQDSGPSWGSSSSVVGNGSQLPEATGEWGGYSSTATKPSTEEWNLDLVHEPSLKPTDVGSNHSATQTSGNGQLTHFSSTDPANNASGWDSIVPEPNEYTLGDKSVSDLLAEVEAMESLNGLASPASMLRCDGELAQGSEHNCFSPLGGLSPAPDPGKSDALSSTNDLQISSQSTVTTNELFGVSKSEALDAHKSSVGHSSTSLERDEDTRSGNVSVKQYEAGSEMQPPAPPVRTGGMASVDTAWRSGPETAGTNLVAVQGNANINWEGLGQGTTSFNRGTDHGTFQETGSINSSTSSGNLPYWGSQQRYVGPRDRDFQGRDSNFGRGKYFCNRQSSYGGSNGVGSFRQPPKGQRVCKYYESGYCKKGVSCSYWHR